MSEPQLACEKLSSVDGDALFYTPELRPYKTKAGEYFDLPADPEPPVDG